MSKLELTGGSGTEEPPGGNGAPEPAVPMAFVQSSIMAHIVAGVLRDNGVEAVVAGEHAAGVFGSAGTSPTGVTVLVRRSDYPRGLEVLRELAADRIERHKQLSERTCPACGYSMRGLEGRDRCPECGASESELAELSRTMIIAPPPREASLAMRVGTTVGCLGLAVLAILAVGWVIWASLGRHGAPPVP